MNNSKNFYISTSVDEIGQMLRNQQINDHPQMSDQFGMNVSNEFHSNQIMNSNNQQQYIPNYVQPNHLNNNQRLVAINSINNVQNVDQAHHQASRFGQSNLSNSSMINKQISRFNVPNIHKYLDPSHYANLPSHTYSNQSTSNRMIGDQQQQQQQLNNKSNSSTNLPFVSSSNQLMMNNKRILNRDLISPNITGLPEVTRTRKSSLSGQDNIYANTSIVSRYVPEPPATNTIDHHSKYSSSSTLNSISKENAKYGASINNEFESLYDPVYFRTNSELSFNSTKDDSYSSIYTPSISSTAGNRQPINALLNDDLDSKLASDRLPTPQPKIDRTIHQYGKKDNEINYLTDFYAQELRRSARPGFFGMCYKCNDTVYEEGDGCVTALGKLFHRNCFLCNVCEKTLSGKAFYIMGGEPYCEPCYLDTLQKCCVCNKPILDRVLRANGNLYHPECLNCCVCGKCLDGVHFTVDHKNKLYCIEDFHEKFAPRCSVCTKPIIPENGQLETVRIVALDRIFHVKCYKCEDCGTNLSSESGKGCFPLDNHILCKECNNVRFQHYLNSTRLS